MRNFTLGKYVATTLLLLISGWSVIASGQANDIAAIKTDTGFLIVLNRPEIHFTLGLTMVSGGSVVILNGVVSERNPAMAVQQLLLNTISTLKVSARPIDVMKLRESIR